ncbi:MAG: F0F1 ATP synthase subunit C [Deltaproteobacteria bacterium]|nr:F0F1 ATP synthase subunit C [Deltaproteobacteria bacterium]
MRTVSFFLAMLTTILVSPGLSLAETAGAAANIPLGAGIAIGIGALGGALGQGKVVSAIADAIGRNPSAAGKMNVPLFVGLALIESLVILAFVVAYGLAGKV